MIKQNIIGFTICIFLIICSISSALGTQDDKRINNYYENLVQKNDKTEIISDDIWLEQAKILASDGGIMNIFGHSVSIDGEYIIIGAQWDDDNGDKSGSAYIFKREGPSWTQQTKLLASDGAAGDYFGYSVSIDGDYAIIGARGDSDNGGGSGSAYIFTRSGITWTEQSKLLASDGSNDDNFGSSVSIDGDYAIIGAHEDDDNGDNSGSAYVFKRDDTSWIQEDKLIALDGETGDHFGYSVSIDGEYAIIGAFNDDDCGYGSGSAYIFIRDGTTWNEGAKILASDGALGDFFGCSVSINGDYVIIGAHADDDNGENSGSAYIYVYSGSAWTQQAKLTASDGETDDDFGWSVSINGDYAIIGAHTDDDNEEDSGSAYIFKREGASWTPQAKLIASDGAENDYFGCSVSIYSDYAIIGAHADDDNGDNSGSAYIFKRPTPDLDCSDNLEWADVQPGETVTATITVENIGNPDTLLDWEIESYPDWGTWTFNSNSGTDLLAGDSVDIDVEVVAPNEEEETFLGEVVLVNSEDPTDTCTIDVSLATPVIQLKSYLFLKLFIGRFQNSCPLLWFFIGKIKF